MATREQVLATVTNTIRVRHFSLRTEEAYRHWIGRFYAFASALPRELPSEEKVRRFITDLAVRQNVAASTQNQAFAAVVFLYREVLSKPLGNIDALRAKRPVWIREAPSRDEVRALFRELRDTTIVPARLLAGLLYGCGLRVQEPLELRIKDVRLSESAIIVRNAKGAKDRMVKLPCSLMVPMKQQVERARSVWQWDRQNRPDIGVSLPHQLARKYPSAPREWAWFWLFPAPGFCEHPRQPGLIVRWRLHEMSLQRAIAHARRKSGVATRITPHVLRHGFATHSPDDPRTIQAVMGHKYLETTMGYIHREAMSAGNPLDSLEVSTSASMLP